MIVDDSVTSWCNLICIILSSHIALLNTKDRTRLTVKLIAANVGMIIAVRDLLMDAQRNENSFVKHLAPGRVLC